MTAADELLDRVLVGPLDPASRIRLQITRAQVAQILGRFDVAEQALGAAVDTAVQADVSILATTAAQLSPALCLIRGGVGHLERFAELARQVLPAGLARLPADGIVASVDLLRGRLDKARATARRVRTEYDRFGGAPPLLGYTLAATHLMAAGASVGGLDEPIRELLHYADLLTKASFMYPNAWFLIGRARWLRGQHDDVRQARARMGSRDDAPAGSAPTIAVNRLTLDGLIAATEGNDRRAEEVLRAAASQEDQVQLVDVYGSARVRLAWFYAERGRRDDALAAVRPALAECERDGLHGRILVEGRAAVPVLRLAAAGSTFAASLLRRLDTVTAPHPVAVPDVAEVLTAREAEVLRLLADGATNRQIAHDLVLGEETVKTHVSRVLRKLDVRTRTAAATRARELGLLS